MLTISWPFGSTSIGGENGGCEVCPFPFWEPVSATPTIALEFPHAAAALWANQIDDRRNDAGVAFAGKLFTNRHGSSPILLWSNAIRSAPCKPKANSQTSREGLEKSSDSELLYRRSCRASDKHLARDGASAVIPGIVLQSPPGP